jgi:hypothetical protein
MFGDLDRLKDRARDALGDETLAAEWLDRKSPLFGDLSPVEAIETSDGWHRALRQLSWFAATKRSETPVRDSGKEALSELLDDPIMDLVLKSAGTGPEELFRLCRGP